MVLTQFSIIVACDAKNNGIGLNGVMPWTNKADLKFFKDVTLGHGNNAVIMGRKTFESIGKPLKGRVNIVLSETMEDASPDYYVFKTIEQVISFCDSKQFDNVFVIGGGCVYKEFLDRDLIDVLYIDTLNNIEEYQYDTFFPKLDNEFVKADFLTDDLSKYNTDTNTVQIYYRKRASQHTDLEYLKLLHKISVEGVDKTSRAGDTISDFCNVLHFDLKEGLPVLTSKKMFFKGCLVELLWFLKGDTNIKYLNDFGTHIWDGDAYRFYKELFPESNIDLDEFLKRVQLDICINKHDGEKYTFGDLGPVYGKQWRGHKSLDQIQNIIDLIKNNPDSRRILLNAWNINDLDKMALPPCHYGCQFYVKQVNNIKYLSCTFNMRSVDTCLGLPYNILSYAALTHIIAKLTGCQVDKLNCFLGDCHIYKNQLNDIYKQLTKNPFAFNLPSLNVNISDINNINIDDIKVENYNSFNKVKYTLSVG